MQLYDIYGTDNPLVFCFNQTSALEGQYHWAFQKMVRTTDRMPPPNPRDKSNITTYTDSLLIGFIQTKDQCHLVTQKLCDFSANKLIDYSSPQLNFKTFTISIAF